MRILLLWVALAVGTVAARGGPRVNRDLEYQPAPFSQRLDVCRPEGAGPFPAVVVLHGGGFSGGSRKDVLPLCERLTGAGFAAVAVDYRLAPQQLFPAPLNDVKSAIRWLRANAGKYEIDDRRIGAMGYNAGGYLALFAALTGGIPAFEGIGPRKQESSRLSCAVAVRPPLDLQSLPDAGAVAFLGGDFEHASAAYRRSNLLNWITPDAAPALLFAAGNRAPRLLERMREAGIEAAGVASADLSSEQIEAQAIAFLRSHLAAVPQTRIIVADHGPGAEVLVLEWPSGRVLWRVPNGSGHDAQMLPNGNILLTLDAEGAVVELNSNREVVWKYGPAEGLKLTISAERLANGNTLIADTGIGKVLEVTPDRKIVWEYASPDLANNRMRHCRRTSAGATLIAIEAASRIIEVDALGRIVWSWSAPAGSSRRPYQGMRLANGNTLISLMSPGELIEVNAAGKTVRSIGGQSASLRIGWASGFDLLPGGHLLLGDYTGQRLIEVDATGTPVRELHVPYRPATVSLAGVQ